jgi:transcriptional regulator with XRE-family HTH domain
MSKQASQSVNRGELELSEEVQNSGFWFRNSRLAVGLSLSALAQQLGAPIQTVSRWEHGQNRPPWPYPERLAAVFHVEVAEVVLQLWGELVGGSCPERSEQHDCNGITILPDDPLVLETLQPALRQYAERALRLLVKITCASCGRERAYTASETHHKVCLDCSRKAVKAERTKCFCKGYHRYGTTPHYGPSCQRKRVFTPGEANEFSSRKKRSQKRWSKYRYVIDGKVRWAKTSGQYRVDWERPFVNLSEQTFRCSSCGFASLRFSVQRARLQHAAGEEIRSEAQHKRLWEENYPDLTPGFDPQVALAKRKQLFVKKDGKDKLYGERHREATSRGKTIAGWLDPDNNEAIVDYCPVCHECNFYYPSKPARFHGPCYNSVRGEVRKGAWFSSHKTGPAANQSKNLKRAFCWTVRHLLNDEEFSVIANDSNDEHKHDRKFVTREIKRILPLLPIPDKVPRFAKIVFLVREAAAKKGLLTNCSNSAQTRAQSGSEA